MCQFQNIRLSIAMKIEFYFRKQKNDFAERKEKQTETEKCSKFNSLVHFFECLRNDRIIKVAFILVDVLVSS